MLNEHFKTYKKNLYKYVLFYIPKISPLDGIEELKEVCNVVIVVKDDGAGYALKKGASNHYAISKKSCLTENVFLLLDHKETLTTEQFDFLTTEYLSQIEFFIQASEWLSENLATYISKNNDELQLSFMYQIEVFKEHQSIVLKHLEIPKETKKIDQKSKEAFFEKQLEELKELIRHGLHKDQSIAIASNLATKSKVTKGKKKKFKEVTEQEAEIDLLEKVFNLKNTSLQ